MQVEAGEKLAIVGESGVGKSSLLNILGLLDRDYRGEYYLFGEKTNGLDEKVLAKWRNQRIGFVLQESAMIHSLTVEKIFNCLFYIWNLRIEILCLKILLRL